MPSISNMSNTSHPNPFDSILERLNGTVSKVSKLRLLLGDLETELNEICQQCVWITRDSQSHKAISPGPIFLQGQERDPATVRTSRKQTRGPGEQKDHLTSSSIISSSNVYRGSGSQPEGVVGKNLFGLIPGLRSWFKPVQAQVPEDIIPVSAHGDAERSSIAGQIPFQPPPRPPTHAPLFPNCFSTYPAELKCEGHDWFVLFNPSPKVKRVLDVNGVFSSVSKDGNNCVKFSQDEKWVAFGGLGIVVIHDMKQIDGPTRILNHPKNAAIGSLCFSPDGKYLATGAFDGKIRVWDITKEQIHDILEGHLAYICSLDFSSNGQFIVSGSCDGTVRIWDVHGRTCKVLTNSGFCLLHETRSLFSVVSPDGRYVAVGGGGAVSIWELTTGLLVQVLTRHKDNVYCLAFTPDGKGLISGGDETLKYWDVSGLGIGSDAGTGRSLNPSPRCIMNFTGHNESVRCTAVSHDGAFLVSGSDDEKILFWDMRTGVVQCTLLVHHDIILDVALSPMDNFLATVGYDGQTRIWRLY